MRMTEKRFEIIKSAIIDGARVIKDNENKYTFATTFETATLINYRKALNELNDENEQLKQRNNRQAKQLDRLYNLIEEKDWRTLSDIIDDFKRCEEQLQKEWRTYSV